jgi:RNA 2',3'-cyclic 3'-phosphodiesterase
MRTFIAVDVESRDAIGRLQNEISSSTGWKPREVKPVEQQNFHFTLIFLGEITDIDAGRIKEKMREVKFEPFTLTYQKVGAFPRPDAAKVIWIGVDPAGGQKLVALANDVISKMAELNFHADKPFSPHMTIFRVKAGPVSIGNISAKYEGKTFGSDLIERVHLKKSDLTPSGPVYSNIYTVEAKK